MEINTKLFAQEWEQDLKKQVEKLKSAPKVAIIIAKDYSAPSKVYVNNKINTCERIGIKPILVEIEWEGKTREQLLFDLIMIRKGCDEGCSFIVQLPFPQITEKDLNRILPVLGDVDGFTNEQKGLLISKEEATLPPCTALGVMRLLKHLHGDLTGKSIAIVNRSNLIGLPLLPMTLEENMTPTIMHSKSLYNNSKGYDIVVTGCGQRKIFNSMSPLIHKNSTIIDCSMTKKEGIDGVGDWDKEDILEEYPNIQIASGYGHTGLLTVLAFCENVIKAHRLMGFYN